MVRAVLLQSTLIVLPEQEKVASVFDGDTVDWVFDGEHIASRFVSIKPKVASSTTDVHIISDHGNEYTLELQKISADAAGLKPHKDGIRLRFTLKTSTDETTRLVAQAMQQQMRAAGIALELRSAEFGTFYSDITRGAFQM